MLKHFLTFIFLIFLIQLKAQFYYSDIVTVNTSNELYANHKKNNIKKVTVKNITKNNEEEDINKFVFKQTYNRDYSQLKWELSLPNGGERTYTTNYSNNKIIRKDDEGLNINSLIRYEYENNLLIAIKTSSIDTSVFDGFFENHFFYYDKNNFPSKMLKVKNNSDTTVVVFEKDEQGNIGEEKWFKKNELIETYYYYYNEKKQLTDIVRFNEKYQKMLPEFIFEYNENNLLSKMTRIPFGNTNYTTTIFDYNNNGLKTFESIYTKRGELLNKVEYSYE